MNRTMRCLVLGKDGKVRLQRRPIPFPDSSSKLLLRVLMAGICSTDLAVLDNRIPGPKPIVMGHEFVAEPVDDPSRRLCVSEINLTCSTCEYCAQGISNHCINRTVLGISTDGVFAEFVQVPRENVHYLPQSISQEQGVFVEPLAAAIQSVHTGNITPEMTVGVLGTGRLGLLQIQVLRALGCQDIIAIERSPEKLGLAEQLGASEILLLDEVGRLDHFPLDVVIETSGSPDGLQTAMGFIKSRGTIVLKSTPGSPALMDLTDIVRREISVLGSRCGPFSEAIELLRRGHIETKLLISGYFTLEEFREAFELSQQHNAIKVLFNIHSQS